MVTEPKSVEPKVSTKEAKCQSSDCETSQQEPVSQVSSTKGARVGIFNAEHFLSRAQMNEKINNILRSPTKPPNGVRQRSVYTNNPSPQASLRVGMTGGQLSQRMSNISLSSGTDSVGHMDRGSSSSLASSASVATNIITSGISKECANYPVGSQSARPYVQLPGIHISNPPQYGPGNMQEIDAGKMAHNTGTHRALQCHAHLWLRQRAELLPVAVSNAPPTIRLGTREQHTQLRAREPHTAGMSRLWSHCHDERHHSVAPPRWRAVSVDAPSPLALLFRYTPAQTCNH
ncbi:uncharacterized protein LOC117194940 isoform X3 [Drosophila miranda]|uniref:uncharacterized protein LOC117194940 isoform X3 n=1 Tax=Drosophila miranda TaxID=7229 RepID=UPI00143F9677|nr:uncharacterized protein LOC117194940 isoform X3 [Drosophila miranda]